MQCVVPNNGQLTLTTDSPAQCQGYLLLTPGEVQQLQPIFAPLTITEGFELTGAILAVWALAFTFRTVRNSFSSLSGDSNA